MCVEADRVVKPSTSKHGELILDHLHMLDKFYSTKTLRATLHPGVGAEDFPHPIHVGVCLVWDGRIRMLQKLWLDISRNTWKSKNRPPPPPPPSYPPATTPPPPPSPSTTPSTITRAPTVISSRLRSVLRRRHMNAPPQDCTNPLI